MKKIILTLMTTVLFTPSAFAGEGPDCVVELFTSQGCSSCPPANKFVADLADDPGILALSYGVTYWDYLGWKDTFAKPEFTKRQRSYGKAFDSANVYTPQIVLNGSAHSSRYSRKDVASMELAGDRPEANLWADEDGLKFSIPHAEDYKVVIVGFEPGSKTVPVKRGENGGRTLAVSNVVTNVTPWTPRAEPITLEAGLNYAALVHDPETTKIVTAAVYKP